MKKKSHRLKQSIIILVIASVWGLVSFIRFPKERLLQFGFTPAFTRIADVSLSEGRYATRLTKYANRPTAADNILIDEVQREPLYPAALMLFKYFAKDYSFLVWLQLLCMIISLYLWGSFSFNRFGWPATIGFFLLMFGASAPMLYTSVLYPYTFAFLFITNALLLLSKGIDSRRVIHFVLAGLCLGGAIYERGVYLLFPAFVFVFLFALCKPLGTRKLHLWVFIISAYLLVAPWLLRNYLIGVYGMNQMAGYALGYTYGYLPGGESSDYKFRYERYIRHRGTDGGTLFFIGDEVLVGNGSYQLNDKKVAALVFKKIKANPKFVAKIIFKNLRYFPCRLLNADRGKFSPRTFDSDPMTFYRRYACRYKPTFFDFITLSLALLGLCVGLRQLQPFAIIGGLFLIYTVSFSTTIVTFDPRYRGASDAVLYFFASRIITFVLIQLKCLAGKMVSLNSSAPKPKRSLSHRTRRRRYVP